MPRYLVARIWNVGMRNAKVSSSGIGVFKFEGCAKNPITSIFGLVLGTYKTVGYGYGRLRYFL